MPGIARPVPQSVPNTTTIYFKSYDLEVVFIIGMFIGIMAIALWVKYYQLMNMLLHKDE